MALSSLFFSFSFLLLVVLQFWKWRRRASYFKSGSLVSQQEFAEQLVSIQLMTVFEMSLFPALKGLVTSVDVISKILPRGFGLLFSSDFNIFLTSWSSACKIETFWCTAK